MSERVAGGEKKTKLALFDEPFSDPDCFESLAGREITGGGGAAVCSATRDRAITRNKKYVRAEVLKRRHFPNAGP